MNQQTSEELRAYFRRVRVIYPELFNMAYAICGNYDLAEYALRSAILEAWQQNVSGGMGFREKLRGDVRRIALHEALLPRPEHAECTWDGLQFPDSDDPLLRQAAQESQDMRRVLALRFGCGLSLARISRIMGCSAAQVRAMLERFESRCRRRLTQQNRRRFDAMMSQAVRQTFVQSGADMPDAAAMYRAFEAEASETAVSTHRIARIVCRVLMLALAILCAILFWFFAVISAPPVLQEQSSPAAESQVFRENLPCHATLVQNMHDILQFYEI